MGRAQGTVLLHRQLLSSSVVSPLLMAPLFASDSSVATHSLIRLPTTTGIIPPSLSSLNLRKMRSTKFLSIIMQNRIP